MVVVKRIVSDCAKNAYFMLKAASLISSRETSCVSLNTEESLIKSLSR